jgi:hypothetical protein
LRELAAQLGEVFPKERRWLELSMGQGLHDQ